MKRLSKVLKPIGTILISSVEVKTDFRPIYLFFGNTGILNHLPVFFFRLRPFFANIIFGAKNKKLLQEILLDTDPAFVKWAVVQLTLWKNEDEIRNCLKLNGSNDFMIPSSKNRKQVILKDGTHFMVVDRASELSVIINEFLTKE